MSSHRVAGALRLIRGELWGLFVDDGVFAGAILVWVVVVGAVLPRFGLPSWLQALLFFAGLAAILVHGAIRAALKHGVRPGKPKS
jgi:hypothetical protein